MIEAFYDDLAPYYKWLYADWNASVTRHASTLDAVIQKSAELTFTRFWMQPVALEHKQLDWRNADIA